MITQYFNLDIPTEPKDHKILGNVLQGADSLAISQVAQNYKGLTVVVTPDNKSAVRLERVLADFYQGEIHLFPDWATFPYDAFSPTQAML